MSEENTKNINDALECVGTEGSGPPPMRPKDSASKKQTESKPPKQTDKKSS